MWIQVLIKESVYRGLNMIGKYYEDILEEMFNGTRGCTEAPEEPCEPEEEREYEDEGEPIIYTWYSRERDI